MNKLQKRALRKKRHKRQQYLKYEAPLDRLEKAIGSLNLAKAYVACPSISLITDENCLLENLHTGECLARSGARWPCNAVAL